MIVIEGADGTGKTTLAREIEKRGWKYVHNGPPPEGISLYDHYTEQILAARGKKVVFDRLHVGELVYGPVMRGKSQITIEEMRLLNRLLFAFNAKIVFCDTDNQTILDNWKKRKTAEYVDTEEKILDIVCRYRRIFDQEFVEYCMFDYREGTNVDDIC
jgi:thymidylate kinase